MKNKFIFISILAVVLCSSCGTVIFGHFTVNKDTVCFPCEESADTIRSLEGNMLSLSNVYEDGERVVGRPLYYLDNHNITGLGGEWLSAYYGAEVGLSVYEVVVRVTENVGGNARKGIIVVGDGTGERYCKIKVTQQGSWLAPASR